MAGRRGKFYQELCLGLTAFAEHFFWLETPTDGSPLRAHFKRARDDGESVPELDGPPCPPAAEYLWSWFLDLHRQRGSSLGGPAPIMWPDLDAWARLTRSDPAPWEVDALMRLDRVFFAALARDGAPPPTEDEGDD